MFWGEFILNDHLFQSSYYADDELENRHWETKVSKNNEIIKKLNIPMMYNPIFGPDVEDVARLEEETEKIIQELGLE